MKRAMIYTRMSVDKREEEDKTSSHEDQERVCREYAADQGWVVVGVVSETGSGATIKARPKQRALLDEADDRKFDILLVKHLDRLARNVAEEGYLRTRLEMAGVELDHVEGSKDKLARQVTGIIAEGERERIVARTSDKVRNQIRAGHYHPSTAPYGYVRVDKGDGRHARFSHFDLDSATAPLVREIFDAMEQGSSMTALCHSLNERGIRAPKGGRWGASTVAAILQNPVYRGELTGMRWKVNRSENYKPVPKARPESDHVVMPEGTAPAIVTEQTWERANLQRQSGRKLAPRRLHNPEDYLLRGFIACGYCGKSMSASFHPRTNLPMYKCTRSATNGCPVSGSMKAAEMDQMVWRRTLEILRDPEWVEANLAAAIDTTDRLTEVRAQIRALHGQEERLAASLARVSNPAPIEAQLNRITTQLQALQIEADELVFQQANTEKLSEKVRAARAYLAEWDRVDAMTFDERRAVLRDFGVQVQLWKRGHDPRWAIEWSEDLAPGPHAADDDWWLQDPDEGEGVRPIFVDDGVSFVSRASGSSRWRFSPRALWRTAPAAARPGRSPPGSRRHSSAGPRQQTCRRSLLPAAPPRR